MRRCPCIFGAVALCATLIMPSSARSAEVLTLAEAVARALRLAPSVANAAAGSDFSEARLREMRGPLFPSLFTSVEYEQTPGYANVVTNRGLSSAQLSLGYTAFDWGRRMAEARGARYASEAARLGVAAARSQIVFDTTLAYFDLVRAREAEKELGKSLDRVTRYVAIIEALRRSGQSNMSDVLRICATRDAAELALSKARQDRETSSVMLGSLIGDYGNAELAVASVPTPPAEPKGSLSENPTLRAAQRSVSSAESDVRAAEAEAYPTFQVSLTTGFMGVDPGKTIANNGGASYDGLVSMPIFEGGAIAARIDEAKARQRSAQAQVRQIKLALGRDLAEASLAYRNARKQLDILARSQSTADDGFNLDWARFLGGGQVTLLEVLDAYQSAEGIRLARFDQQFALWKSVAQACLALGQDQ